ncbi:MAG: hypothetical protein AMS20_00050 [Gemmatimonas sp. SG8_28]|nr:MAG: hypothetical protein AMS20_00050 [Gemmatimonas sp. SG8_28]
MSEHIVACQIGDLTTPTAGAELWYLADATYGKQTDSSYAKAPISGGGEGSPLLLRTQPFAPAGDSGITMLRRIYAKFEHIAGFTVTITPIIDFNERLTAKSFAAIAPVQPVREIVEYELEIARRCTWVQVEIELVTWFGRVELLGLSLADKPITVGASSVVGVE